MLVKASGSANTQYCNTYLLYDSMGICQGMPYLLTQLYLFIYAACQVIRQVLFFVIFQQNNCWQHEALKAHQKTSLNYWLEILYRWWMARRPTLYFISPVACSSVTLKLFWFDWPYTCESLDGWKVLYAYNLISWFTDLEIKTWQLQSKEYIGIAEHMVQDFVSLWRTGYLS